MSNRIVAFLLVLLGVQPIIKVLKAPQTIMVFIGIVGYEDITQTVRTISSTATRVHQNLNSFLFQACIKASSQFNSWPCST